MADFVCTTYRETLTDGSEVFNVCLFRNETGRSLTLAAVTEAAALALAEKIADAINEHTVSDAVTNTNY
jgi:hypothetical protein